jgi:hypothetical protein
MGDMSACDEKAHSLDGQKLGQKLGVLNTHVIIYLRSCPISNL